MNPQYPTYPAPPPPRQSSTGRTCLFAFLGCLGVGAVLVAILTVLAVGRIREARNHPTVTAATLKQFLGPDIPVYPGMTLDEAQTNSQIAMQSIIKPGGVQQTPIIFRSQDGTIKVTDWYSHKLTKLGWTESQIPMPGFLQGMHINMYRKGTRVVQVAGNPVDSTLITLTLFTGTKSRTLTPVPVVIKH